MNIGINDLTMNPSGFVVLADYVPHIVQKRFLTWNNVK